MLPKADCIIWLTVTLALAIATVTLNFIAISIFTKHRNFRNRNAYLLINLAVADILVGGFCTVNEFYYYGWFCNIWRSDWPRYVSFMRLAVFLYLPCQFLNKYHCHFFREAACNALAVQTSCFEVVDLQNRYHFCLDLSWVYLICQCRSYKFWKMVRLRLFLELV